MDYANDKYDVMAMLFGGPGYLTPKQRVDLATIFRTIAKDERAACLAILQKLRDEHDPPGERADIVAVERFDEAISAIRSRTEGEGT